MAAMPAARGVGAYARASGAVARVWGRWLIVHVVLLIGSCLRLKSGFVWERCEPAQLVVRVRIGAYARGVSEERAVAGVEATGIAYEVTRHGPVRSLAEAAAARGIEPSQLVKSLVVRRADDDFLFVLVPGDRTISWPKLRQLLGVSRLSMPDAAIALEVTGYERGTITPFGSLGPGRSWSTSG